VLALLLVVGLLALLLGAWAGLRAVRDQPMVGSQVPAIGVVELALVVQTVVVAVGMSNGATSADPMLLWGYLVTQLVLLPVAFAWAFVERTRWSSVVLAVVCVVVVVLQVRIWQIWLG